MQDNEISEDEQREIDALNEIYGLKEAKVLVRKGLGFYLDLAYWRMAAWEFRVGSAHRLRLSSKKVRATRKQASS